ncbi:hypothetical protein KTC96_24940 (plasmid) [Clostridium estertheticum]|uniref:hypothetical protein n=1 Tax=Clostridium estertheticum TaxID=238834 RepID=UPI001C7DBB70|nr:hypothetical protein [Clostridium estertheticum]MBX4259776.1 hypothetical protein [Clostridium estertheticum]WLC73268.1 hypothetical protein KTC96_24940 [Clostridium estertheticum]
MQNTLGDLNNHLFAQLERLGEEDLSGDKLLKEINRAKSITDVATRIIANGSLVLQAEKFKAETLGRSKAEIPKMLEG